MALEMAAVGEAYARLSDSDERDFEDEDEDDSQEEQLAPLNDDDDHEEHHQSNDDELTSLATGPGTPRTGDGDGEVDGHGGEDMTEGLISGGGSGRPKKPRSNGRKLSSGGGGGSKPAPKLGSAGFPGASGSSLLFTTGDSTTGLLAQMGVDGADEDPEKQRPKGKRRLSGKKGIKGKFGRFAWFLEPRTEKPVDGPFGWLVVLASFLVHVMVVGFTYSFGIYFREYLKVFPDVPPSQVSFIGTLSPGIFPLVGIFTGRLADKYGARLVVSIGIIIQACSLILASFSTEVWHLMLTQGVLLGIGSAFCYFPAVALVPTWFDKKRGIATGMAVAGSGVGGFIMSPLSQFLIQAYDWRVALRVTAVACFLGLWVAWIFLFQRIPAGKKGPLFYFDLFKDKVFVILYLGSLSATFGFLLPYFYLSLYAQTVANLTPAQGALLLGILNGSSGFGRFTLGFVGDRFGRMNLFCVCMFMGAASTFFWPLCTNFGSLIVYCIIFGLFGGGFISMVPVVIADFWGTDRISGIMGIFFSSTAFGNLFGVSVGGMIYQATGNDFTPAAFYAASMMMFAFLCDLTVKILKEPIKMNILCCK